MWKLFAFFVCISFCVAEECSKCERSNCTVVNICPFGVIQDACGCCEICAQGLGQKCDFSDADLQKNSIKPVNGTCGQYLFCSEDRVCHCEEDDPVCGSDGVTYDSVCSLMDATSQDKELTLEERGPCRDGPVIKSPPKDSSRPLASILVLDCEATGFPVPTIIWELYRPDGSVIPLPNDDPLIAVQVRGGPEKNMASGWVQIMELLPENVGVYTCVATNSKGTAKAGANVTIGKGKTQKKKE